MKALWFGIILVVPGLANGQPVAPPQSFEQRTQMYEDIEVLRRLLDSKLQSQYAPLRQHGMNTLWYGYGTPNVSTNVQQFLQPYVVVDVDGSNQTRWKYSNVWPNGTLTSQAYVDWLNVHAVATRSLDTQGVYLKGQGVLYTVTLPHPPKPRADTPKPPSPSVSDWDRVRREVRNEKAEPEKKEAPPHKDPTLTEILLEVLAENGHHFTRLAENESLTVVVTFPAEGQPAPKTTSATAPKPAGATADTSGRDYELLGDLHLRQGNAVEAEKAYRQAVDQSTSSRRRAALLGKCAQALITAGKTAEAAHLLNDLVNAAKKEPAAPAPAAQATAATRPALPAKLIVSVSKKVLDQAAGGKMTVEELQKAATVDYLNFTPAQP
jgi:hypothetical protein